MDGWVGGRKDGKAAIKKPGHWVEGWKERWTEGWMDCEAGLRIACSNQ